VWAIYLPLIVSAVLPRAEDPWPDTIGVDFPFSMAGAFGFIAGALFVGSSPARRDRAIRWGGLLGFLGGMLLYVVAFAAAIG
jgi:hypothetical protein